MQNPIRIGDISSYKKRDFLKRIPQDVWDKIIEKIEGRQYLLVPEELEALERGQWNHSIFQDPDWCFFAFHAYLENRLDQDTMCKLFLYNACYEAAQKEDSCIGAPKMQTFRLFNAFHERDSRACKALKEAVSSYLSDKEFEQFLQTLQYFPPHRTQFFIVRRKWDETLEMIVSQKEIGWELCVLKGVKFGCSEGEVWQVVASPELMYEIHKAKFGENAIRPKPVLGYANVEKLSDFAARVVSIPSFVPLPDEVHGVLAAPLTFYHHDIAYHHAIESANQHRSIWILFALFVKEIIGPGQMMEVVLDREFLNYLRDRKESSSENFWLSVLACSKYFDADKQGKEELISLFKEFYRRNQQVLSEEAGLSLDSLKESVYASILDAGTSPEDCDFLEKLYFSLAEQSHDQNKIF